MSKSKKTESAAPAGPVVVDDQLLAMVWPSANAARMYFTRRGTSLKQLGLVVSAHPRAGFRVERVETLANDPYEGFAVLVDEALEAAGEEAATEAVLRTYFDAGSSPAAAAQAIIASRADALTEAVDVAAPAAEPMFEGFYRSVLEALQAASQDGCPPTDVHDAWRRGVSADEAAREVIELRAPQPAAVEEALVALTDVGAVIEARPLPARDLQVYLRLAAPVEWDSADVWGPQIAKQMKLDVVAVNAETGEVVGTFFGRKPKADKPERTASSTGKPRQAKTLPTILELLARDEGVTGEEIQAALGWENTPGPWFFRHWTKQAKRAETDLVELPKLDGKRRFHLPRAV